jgi:hypothetical protein
VETKISEDERSTCIPKKRKKSKPMIGNGTSARRKANCFSQPLNSTRTLTKFHILIEISRKQPVKFLLPCVPVILAKKLAPIMFQMEPAPRRNHTSGEASSRLWADPAQGRNRNMPTSPSRARDSTPTPGPGGAGGREIEKATEKSKENKRVCLATLKLEFLSLK